MCQFQFDMINITRVITSKIQPPITQPQKHWLLSEQKIPGGLWQIHSRPHRPRSAVSTINRDLWPIPIFEQKSLSIIFIQSDLLVLTMSPWIADFWCWERPEVSIFSVDQKDCGLWGRECGKYQSLDRMRNKNTNTCHQDWRRRLFLITRSFECDPSFQKHYKELLLSWWI